MNRTTRRWWAALAGVALAGVIGAGCKEGDYAANPMDESGRAALDRSGSAIGMGALAGITPAELDERLDLSDEQSRRLASALSDSRRDRGDEWGRPSGRRGGFAGRDGRAGRAGRTGPAMQGPPSQPPVHGFLEEAAGILTTEQFTELAELIQERRETWREQAAAGGRGRGRGMRGPGAGGPMGALGPMGARMAEGLDLTEAQLEAIRPILEERAEEARRIHEQVREGTIPRAEVRDRMRASQDETRAQIHALLTPKQVEKANARREERTGDRVEKRLERMEQHLDRRATFLDRVLGLTDEQAARVRELMLSTAKERSAVMTQLRSDATDPSAAGEAMERIENELAASITALLTDEQRIRWEAVRKLMPGRGPRP